MAYTRYYRYDSLGKDNSGKGVSKDVMFGNESMARSFVEMGMATLHVTLGTKIPDNERTRRYYL